MDKIKYREKEFPYLPTWTALGDNIIDKCLIGKGLDIGCGGCCFPDAIGIDMASGSDGQDLSDYSDNQFNYVLSSHSIEHMTDWNKTLDEWIRVIRPGGHVVLIIPDPDHFPYSKEGAKGWHLHDIRMQDIIDYETSRDNVCIVYLVEPVKGRYPYQYFVVLEKKY